MPSKPTPTNLTADEYVRRLTALQSDDELRKIQRYFKTDKGEYGEGDIFLGVRMGHVFELSKEFIDLPPAELERLLDHEYHEVRAGALSTMSKQAAHKRTTEDRRQELFDLYLRRHDRINNWDLVDVAAPNVIGRHLQDRPRDILYQLAQSEVLWERRTAMVATLHFIKQGDLDDVFTLAELLLHDEHDLIHKPVGGNLRFAGQQDRPRLIAFLDRHAATMPRTALRYAIEKLEPAERKHYLALKDA